MSDNRLFEVAEVIARDELERRGYNAVVTGSGPDGGVDVADLGRGLVAQVKLWQNPVGSRELQQLIGAGAPYGARTFAFFSSGGYTHAASEFAASCGMALFSMDLRGAVSASNSHAETLSAQSVDGGPPPAVGGMSREEDELRRRADDGDAEAMHLLAELLSGSDRWVEAEYWTGRAAHLGHVQAMHDLADHFLYSETDENEEEAVTWYRAAAERGHSEAMMMLVSLDHDTERWLAAAAERGEPDALAQLAAAARDTGDIGAAEDLYRKAAAAGAPKAFHDLAVMLEAAGRFDDAEHCYRQQPGSNLPSEAEALVRFLERRGRIDDAEKVLRDLLADMDQLDPADSDDLHFRRSDRSYIAYLLGELLRDHERFDGAIQLARAELERAAPDEVVEEMCNLACALHAAGRYAEAEGWARKVIATEDDEWMTPMMRTLAQLLDEVGRHNEAQELRTQAEELDRLDRASREADL